jgi:hypothetical protein
MKYRLFFNAQNQYEKGEGEFIFQNLKRVQLRQQDATCREKPTTCNSTPCLCIKQEGERMIRYIVCLHDQRGATY